VNLFFVFIPKRVPVNWHEVQNQLRPLGDPRPAAAHQNETGRRVKNRNGNATETTTCFYEKLIPTVLLRGNEGDHRNVADAVRVGSLSGYHSIGCRRIIVFF